MGHLSMIVFQKCVVMPRIFGGYWGALLTLRLISWQRKNWVFQPNNKIKISVQKVNFNCFGKSLQKPPMNIPSPSLEPSTPKVTRCHCISQDTFLYHRFILSVLCYSSFLHWYDGPIYMLRPSESLLANNQLTTIIEWFRTNTASLSTINPIQGFSII